MLVNAAKQQHFDQRPDAGDKHRRHQQRQPKAAGHRHGLVAYIGAQHVQRTVCQIDNAQKPENQGQSGSQKKQKNAYAQA